MAEHTLKRYDEELERLSATISEMGGLAESQLAQSLVALRRARHRGRREGDRRATPGSMPSTSPCRSRR